MIFYEIVFLYDKNIDNIDGEKDPVVCEFAGYEEWINTKKKQTHSHENISQSSDPWLISHPRQEQNSLPIAKKQLTRGFFTMAEFNPIEHVVDEEFN